MKSSRTARTIGETKTKGFALITILMMMILLTILAMGMLSLSSISLRGASQNSKLSEARSNARMALMIAIGRLQAELGSDQRISANGAILAASPVEHPHWTGVWDSWIAGTVNPTTVNPDYPSPASHHQTIALNASGVPDNEMHPSYEKINREDYFRSWLVSLDPENAEQVASALSFSLIGETMPGSAANAVTLVSDGSVDEKTDPITGESNEVVVPLLSVMGGKDGTTRIGRYGWWVGDESQKANIMDNSYKTSNAKSLAERLSRQQAPASMGNSKISGLENITDEIELSFVPSRSSLALVDGATSQTVGQFHDISTASLGVLADVREGGLKRDLSTILERTIDPSEVYNLTSVVDFERASSLTADGEDFMLYNFDNMVESTIGKTGEASVPIQDLAAYYQLYDRYRSGSEGGIQYSSNESSPSNSQLNNGIMVSNPDYGQTQSDGNKFLRQYTALYRSPVPVKIEIMLSYVAEPIFPAPTLPNGNPDPNADKYRLRVGVTPAMTFWNPNNVPLVMNMGNPDSASVMFRETPIPLQFKFKKTKSRSGPTVEENIVQFNKITNTQQGELYTLFIAGNYPAVFEPGESKVFAMRFASNTNSTTASNFVDFALRGRVGNRYAEQFIPDLELTPGWNSEKFIRPTNQQGGGGRTDDTILTFSPGDYISASIEGGNYNSFVVDYTQKSRHGRNAPGVKWHFRSFGIRSRLKADAEYKNNLVYQGFPLSGAGTISDSTQRPIEIPARQADTLIAAMQNPFNPRDDLPQAFFYYGMKAGVETHESENLSPILGGAGRRFPSRPFTHSTAMAPAFLDSTDPSALYNYGWNWFFMPLDNHLDAPISISNSNSGYFGGGYTAENGVTNIVQQQLPLTPPFSIAALSHAHLGGFSLGTEAPAAGYNGLRNPTTTEAFRRVTAVGFDGLAPHTLQAIGNSYAHPNIPANKALGTWDRRYVGSQVTKELFADHSYLANKALWDEFFFSSISPKPADSKVFSGSMTAQERARDFFIEKKPLPNPRIVSTNKIGEDELDKLLSSYDQYKDGFADKIAAHLMVEGPFNVNSTSVTAWKALFFSLKGQQVSYLDAESALSIGMNLDHAVPEGVPLPGGPLPNGKSYKGSSSDPSDREQWTGFRELTDTEIEELATAMVKQVKLRGPFLSLSDFINRRLDDSSSATQFALKGALQAAIDDPAVSINEGFRDDRRKFTNAEKSFVTTEFPEAMEGPIAYGSSAYVDQADMLRNFPAQLTPRGDTFVIRAYGDSLDSEGNILARAWCEATVQRTPAYVDGVDEPEVKQADLSSQNQDFGRKFIIVQFRWLNSSEI